MADPGPVASIFWLDNELESSIFLDAVITVVDSKFIVQHLNEVRPDGAVNEAQRQIAFADIILLNKRDLVTDKQAEVVKERVREINQLAPILSSTKSVVDLNQILDKKAFDPDPVLIEPYLRDHKVDCCDEAHVQGHVHHGNPHDNRITTITIFSKGSVDLLEFNRWLGNLVWEEKANDLYRMKGVVAIRGENIKHSLQGVHDLFNVEPSPLTWDDEEPYIKLVLIGKQLDKLKLESQLQDICNKPIS